MERIDLAGAISVQVIYVLGIAVFVARLLGRTSAEPWIGALLFTTAIPLVYLPVSARPWRVIFSV